MDLEATFEQYDEEFLKFDRIERPRSRRPDLHAFLLLDELAPDDCDMVSAAEHDEIWLQVDVDRLSLVATEEIIRELVRCGVRYDPDHACLAMFV